MAIVKGSLEGEIDTARAAAVAAGEVLLRHFRTDVRVDRKDRGEPVTEADRAAQAVILESISTTFPDDGVLAEEHPDRESWLRYRRAWVIDPMDGTRDFIAGREGFCVMIGLLLDQRPVLGVMHQPTTGYTYVATAGGPALLYRGGEATNLAVSTVDDPAQARLVTSASRRPPRGEEIRKSLGIVDEQRLGSLGLKLGLIARGDRDLYLNTEGNCSLWDTCAPEVVLTAAGGRVTDLAGESLCYSDASRIRLVGGVVASNGRIHEDVIARVAPFFAISGGRS